MPDALHPGFVFAVAEPFIERTPASWLPGAAHLKR